MNYPAHAYPITIPQGEDYSKTWTYYPNGTDAAVQNWTGWSGTAQLRRRIEDTTALTAGAAYYDVELTDPGGKVMRFVGGKAQITAEVTR